MSGTVNLNAPYGALYGFHAAFDEYVMSVDPDVSIIPALILVAYTHMETLGWL